MERLPGVSGGLHSPVSDISKDYYNILRPSVYGSVGGKPAEGGGPGVGIRDGGEDSTGCSLFSRRRRAFKLV